MHDFSQLLLEWYDNHKRILPWRDPKGGLADPYYVWVSEIMLQQTTVATVGAYFTKFIGQWPTVHDLAAASLEEVLHTWQGLGYYSRARNLHKCAQYVVAEYDGCFPSVEKELLRLPGVGAYTAAAIRTIAFQQPAVVIDANVIRVLSRVFALKHPLPQLKSFVEEKAAESAFQEAAQRRPGDYAQALMDLGATICTPTAPKCLICPLKTLCKGYQEGNPAFFPIQKEKPLRPTRQAVFFWVENGRGEVFLEQRPSKGLLGGMMGFPSDGIWDKTSSLPPIVSQERIGISLGEVEHTFTHFHLKGSICPGRAEHIEREGRWVHPQDFSTLALPTLMKKIIKAVDRGRSPTDKKTYVR